MVEIPFELKPSEVNMTIIMLRGNISQLRQSVHNFSAACHSCSDKPAVLA